MEYDKEEIINSRWRVDCVCLLQEVLQGEKCFWSSLKLVPLLYFLDETFGSQDELNVLKIVPLLLVSALLCEKNFTCWALC